MNGARVGITAARRAAEQASLVRALGGVPVVGSTIDIDRAADDTVVLPPLALAAERPLDLAVFMTGIGARHLMGVASRGDLEEQWRGTLERARVIARGAKARRALRTLDVRVDALADPPDSTGLLAVLDPPSLPAGTRVAVQCAGLDEDPVVAPLRAAGAEVVTLHPYAIATPADDSAAVALARAAMDGDLAAITFTSANAVNGFAALADRAGLDAAAIAPGVLVVAVGAVTRAALEAHGVRVDVEPETPRMGAMYQALAARLSAA